MPLAPCLCVSEHINTWTGYEWARHQVKHILCPLPDWHTLTILETTQRPQFNQRLQSCSYLYINYPYPSLQRPSPQESFHVFYSVTVFKTFCAGCVATLKMISYVDPKLELINKVQFVLLQSNNVQRCSFYYRCNFLSRSLSDRPTL